MIYKDSTNYVCMIIYNYKSFLYSNNNVLVLIRNNKRIKFNQKYK